MEFNIQKLAKAYNSTNHIPSYKEKTYCPMAETVNERFGDVWGHTINYEGKNYLISFDFHEDSDGDLNISDLTLQCELTDNVFCLTVDEANEFEKEVEIKF